MNDEIITTEPETIFDIKLKEKYAECLAGQVELMDTVGAAFVDLGTGHPRFVRHGAYNA